MALIKCIDCGAEISSVAPVCPKCGRRTSVYTNEQQAKSNSSIGCISLLITTIIFVIIFFVGC